MARLQSIDEVPLSSIQPGEDFLCQESVEYFLKNPNILSLEIPSILIFSCSDQPFQYYAIDGNSRLFVCYRLGILKIKTALMVPAFEYLYLPVAPEVYSQGIRSWRDLERRILPIAERDHIRNAV